MLIDHICDIIQDMVVLNVCAEFQVRRSKDSACRAQTDGQTHNTLFSQITDYFSVII